VLAEWGLIEAALGGVLRTSQSEKSVLGRGMRVPRSREELMKANAELVVFFRVGVIASFALMAVFVLAR
jgi:hypothetical protein